jgi:hypothetical protein
MARTNPRDGELLSLPACRRLLGPVGDSLSDAEVVQLRDQLYALAQSAVAAFAQDAGDEQEATVLGCLPPAVREAVEERAAILQFDAHLPRGLATRIAISACVPSKQKST